MSFRKPFRAEPVVLGEYARTAEATRRRRNIAKGAIKLVAVTTAVFGVAMAATNWPSIWSWLSPEPAMTPGTHKPFAYYRNCGAARAAGVTPILAGEPGYRPELDEDGDGIACEPFSAN